MLSHAFAFSAYTYVVFGTMFGTGHKTTSEMLGEIVSENASQVHFLSFNCKGPISDLSTTAHEYGALPESALERVFILEICLTTSISLTSKVTWDTGTRFTLAQNSSCPCTLELILESR